MITDPLATAGLVTREIRTGSRDGRPTKIATARRTYGTHQADLWDALTDRERLPRWFLPVSGDIDVGGRYQLEGNAGGTIERCDPPRSFTATWEYAGEVTWIEVRLEPEDERRTRLVLEHVAHVDDERWLQYGPGAVGVGWDLALVGLALYVASGVPNDPQAWAAWMTSPEAVEFVTRSSRGWADANIAAGTDASEAHAAGERTTAFYTASPA
jgi:uncharacterized protein YndB with AHSA1/START domain